MTGDELIKDLGAALDRAHAARPDIAPEHLLATLGPGGGAQSIEEFNASGEEMCFVCVKVEPRDFGRDEVVKHSIITVCGGCLCEVWLSPATAALRAQIVKKKLLCTECAMKTVPKNGIASEGPRKDIPDGD